MTSPVKNQTAARIAVMQAYMDGKQIQRRPANCSTWSDCADPQWDWACVEYRVKPTVMRYRRYLYSATGLKNHAVVQVLNENNAQVAPDIERLPPFIRWIDTDWQEVAL